MAGHAGRRSRTQVHEPIDRSAIEDFPPVPTREGSEEGTPPSLPAVAGASEQHSDLLDVSRRGTSCERENAVEADPSAATSGECLQGEDLASWANVVEGLAADPAYLGILTGFARKLRSEAVSWGEPLASDELDLVHSAFVKALEGRIKRVTPAGERSSAPDDLIQDRDLASAGSGSDHSTDATMQVLRSLCRTMANECRNEERKSRRHARLRGDFPGRPHITMGRWLAASIDLDDAIAKTPGRTSQRFHRRVHRGPGSCRVRGRTRTRTQDRVQPSQSRTTGYPETALGLRVRDMCKGWQELDASKHMRPYPVGPWVLRRLRDL